MLEGPLGAGACACVLPLPFLFAGVLACPRGALEELQESVSLERAEGAVRCSAPVPVCVVAAVVGQIVYVLEGLVV
jgi:hypothetical protein